jgi:EAL domain-containing protein (putative c-di-GMP-specific phosphodiesterase class I)
MMQNAESAAHILARLKGLQVHLAIDDFGTGYSSLSHLHRFPFDMLKIDKSFVVHLGEDLEASKIVQTIVLLARNLGLKVIAEGAETLQQLQILRDLECDMVQGFYFSRPVEAAMAEELLEESRREALLSEDPA